MDYDIEVYDPLPVDDVLPVTLSERILVRDVLQFERYGRHKPMHPPLKMKSVREQRSDLIEALLARLPDDSRLLPSAQALQPLSQSEEKEDTEPSSSAKPKTSQSQKCSDCLCSTVTIHVCDSITRS